MENRMNIEKRKNYVFVVNLPNYALYHHRESLNNKTRMYSDSTIPIKVGQKVLLEWNGKIRWRAILIEKALLSGDDIKKAWFPDSEDIYVDDFYWFFIFDKLSPLEIPIGFDMDWKAWEISNHKLLLQEVRKK